LIQLLRLVAPSIKGVGRKFSRGGGQRKNCQKLAKNTEK